MSHSSASAASFPSSLPRISTSFKKQPLISPPLKKPFFPTASLRIGVQDIIDLAHNKVLVASAAACAIGQLSKPLTSALNGGGIDLRAAFRSGGMPSTHSAGVAAAATSLGLERGFSDPIFGMSAVFAVLVMYDAQGVRREVGYHAKILNMLLKNEAKSTRYREDDDSDDSNSVASITSNNISPLLSKSKKVNFNTLSSESYSSSGTKVPSSKLDILPSLRIDGEETTTNTANTHIKPLNESVGHTEIQVIVGAMLGFVLSLTVYTIL